MNLNDILNNTIAGLLVALICTCFGLLYKFIKKKHSENSELFWLYTRFIIMTIGTLAGFSSITSEDSNVSMLIRLIIFAFNLGGEFMVFNDAIHYVEKGTNNSNKKN